MATSSIDASNKECMMSNESNRETHTVSPSDLQASDFFPPGHGWNKDEDCAVTTTPRKPQPQRDYQDELAEDGRRQH
jgi:hypothetical protein